MVSSKRCYFLHLLTLYPLRRWIAPPRKFIQSDIRLGRRLRHSMVEYRLQGL